MDLVRELPSHLMRPERKQWEQACDVVRGHDDPRRSWDALARASLLPAGWVDAPARRYCERVEDQRSVFPPSIAMALALAADGERLLEVEREARGAAAALEPWGGARPERLTFCATARPHGSRHRTLAHYVAGELAGSTRTQRDAVRDDEAQIARWFEDQPRQAWGPSDYHAGLEARWDFDAQMKWDAAVRGRGTIDERFVARQPRRVRRALTGRKLAGLPSPFVPRICLWHLGYAISAITSEEILLSIVVDD